MCEFSGKMMAWIDGELPAGKDADVERHKRFCTECQNRIRVYKQVSASVEAYCEAAVSKQVHPRVSQLMFLASAAAAVVLAVFLGISHARFQSKRTPLVTASIGPLPSVETEISVGRPAKVLGVRRQNNTHDVVRTAARQRKESVENTTWIPAEPAIQIAIPAEAMFPPGSVPEGASFTVDLTIGADGSAQQLRLRP
jgi:anti-sigma factor RsiW